MIAKIEGHRKLEWLAGRWLLHWMSGRSIRGACLKDEFGKPYLEDSKLHISISHSRKMVAVMAGPKAVGIDIQLIVPKITRLAHKFLNKKEAASISENHSLAMLHIYWGAKESLYKGYGRKKLDFKDHIKITPFTFNTEGGDLEASVEKENYKQPYWLKYQLLNNYVLVYGMEE